MPPIGIVELRQQDEPTTTAPTTATTVTTTTAAPPTSPSLPARPPTTAAPPVVIVPLAPTAPTTLAPTTTATPATTADDAASPLLVGALVVAALVLAGLAVLVLTRLRRRPGRRVPDWTTGLRDALVDIDLTDDLALTHCQTPDPRPFGQVLTPRFHALHRRLTEVEGQVTDPFIRQQIDEVADALQSFAFATEAEWMLRESSTPPTAEQLIAAGDVTAQRHAALEHSLRAVRASLGAGAGRR